MHASSGPHGQAQLIVLADDKDACLVLDSTVCHANAFCFAPEHVRNPSALDVARTFLPEDEFAAWSGLSLDVQAAHKRIKVRMQDQGTLLFRFAGKLWHYCVCHFGAKFSTY